MGFEECKEKADSLLKKGEYESALKYFESALKLVDDLKAEILILSNIAWCFINLRLYEDALEYCNRALDIDEDHVKSLYC